MALIIRPLRELASFGLLLVPAGGQGTARRNAWAGMSECAGRTRSRREADEALALLAPAPEPRDGHGDAVLRMRRLHPAGAARLG